MAVKVFLSGEGASDIGNRDYSDQDGIGRRVGALEAILRRVVPVGWSVTAAVRWGSNHKFAVGRGLRERGHGDIRNVVVLALRAVEAQCDVLAFTRDVDAERGERADAIAQGIDRARERYPEVDIIGGAASPAIEGWILALLGVRDTQAMSRTKANALLAQRDLGGKGAEDYCDVITSANLDALPPGCDALGVWIATARTVLGDAIRGAPAT